MFIIHLKKVTRSLNNMDNYFFFIKINSQYEISIFVYEASG